MFVGQNTELYTAKTVTKENKIEKRPIGTPCLWLDDGFVKIYYVIGWWIQEPIGRNRSKKEKDGEEYF